MGFFSEYDINTNPGTANSVSTAAFRFVASLLPGKTFFTMLTIRFLEELGLDNLKE